MCVSVLYCLCTVVYCCVLFVCILVLSRPYALVLGSHEDDVHMTQGVEGEY